ARLTPYGYELGLISKDRYERFNRKWKNINDEITRLENTPVIKGAVTADKLQAFLGKAGNKTGDCSNKTGDGSVSYVQEDNKAHKTGDGSVSYVQDDNKAQKVPVAREAGEAAVTVAGSAAGAGGLKLAAVLRRPEVTYEALAEIDPDRPLLASAQAEEVGISIKYDGYIRRQREQVEKFRKLENRIIPEGVNYKGMHGISTEALQKLDRIRPVSIGQASRISGVSPADIAVLLIHLKD
ncbi:MAG: hypothetical protein PHG48_06850, partial [Eubacteriales bacterium]|nr:hypothetical protein [Eubacteriales bacterium]